MEHTFLQFIIQPDIHDGTILRIQALQSESTTVRVLIKRATDDLIVLAFRQVQSLHAHAPEGMLLYSLSEMYASPPFRCFVLTNWDEDDSRAFEVLAHEVVSYTIANEDAFLLHEGVA